MRRELSFYVIVMLLGIAGVALLKLGAATKTGENIPGLRPLANLI